MISGSRDDVFMLCTDEYVVHTIDSQVEDPSQD
ncbi:hypothetical protein A2U01_0041344 [Trifolium medium]|uniref:Uncharacterized protein n=1 Tax=Trifolium medium TaxID=97028 RepID=A0A392Q703_9FABA|nr:hypothetical protein [Trifolium medium]